MSRKQRKRAAMVLSSLLATDDGEMESFRDLRAGDPELDPKRLLHAREVLEAIHTAIVDDDPEAWRAVDEAWRGLGRELPHDAAERAADGEPPGSPADEEGVEPPPSIGSILKGEGVEVPEGVASSPASPWTSVSRTGEHPAPASAPTSQAASSRREPPERPQPSPASERTMAVRADWLDAQALPFDGKPASEQAAWKPAPAADPLAGTLDLSPQKSAPKGAEMLDGPLGSTMRMRAVREPSTPASQAPSLPSHLAGFTIEQYASLCAECAVHPGHEKEICLERYGLRHRDERRLLDRVFDARMKADPELAETWRATYVRVEQWAKQQP
jgi:hypothetical protein